MREIHLLSFGLRLEIEELHHSAILTKIEQHFGGFFHQIKVRQPIGRKDSMQTVSRTSRRFNSFCMERLRTLNSYKIFEIKTKKLKTCSGWCPFKGLSNDISLMQIQSGRTVPLKLIGSEFTLLTKTLRPYPPLVIFLSPNFVLLAMWISDSACCVSGSRFLVFQNVNPNNYDIQFF